MFSENRIPQNENRFITILTTLGKFMGRMSDLINIDFDEKENLRIAMCKFLMSICVKIANDINELGVDSREFADNLRVLLAHVYEMREMVAEILTKSISNHLPDSNNGRANKE